MRKGNHVVVKFEDGSEERAKLVIGADGLRSVVRGVVDQNATLRYSGQTSYRATVLVEGPIGFERTAWEVWGRGCRLGFSRVHIGEMYYYITIDAPAAEKDEGGTALLKLQRLFAGFPAPIPQLVAAMEERALLKTDIYDLSPLSHWHRGRVVLLGDAAHATTPNLGQGGAQAIEDAWVLADQLARTKEHTTAFSSYQKIRQPKANKITDVSWNLGKLAHLKNPTACHLRDFALRLMPKALVQRQAESQYPLNY